MTRVAGVEPLSFDSKPTMTSLIDAVSGIYPRHVTVESGHEYGESVVPPFVKALKECDPVIAASFPKIVIDGQVARGVVVQHLRPHR